MTTRRTVLSLMGLGSASVGAEAFFDNHGQRPDMGTSPRWLIPHKDFGYTDESFARALEKLAAEVRAGNINPGRLNVSGTITGGESMDWVRHKLEFEFEWQPDKADA